jgi:hypothetical protein
VRAYWYKFSIHRKTGKGRERERERKNEEERGRERISRPEA